jgi:hypothetical protein
VEAFVGRRLAINTLAVLQFLGLVLVASVILGAKTSAQADALSTPVQVDTGKKSENEKTKPRPRENYCRWEKDTQSPIKGRMVCMSKKEWELLEKETKSTMERVQFDGTPGRGNQ